MKKEVFKALKERSELLLTKMDVELVDFEIERQGSKQELVFYIFHKDGTGIELCESVSRRLEEMIESEFQFESPYHLVVSSPDLSRPLKTDSDLNRNLGVELEIKLRKAIAHNYTVVGKLITFDSDVIVLESAPVEVINIPRSDVKEMKVYIDF